MLHAGNISNVYYTFTPEVDGYYTFTVDTDVHIYVYEKDTGYQEIKKEEDYENYLTHNTVFLSKDLEYKFVISVAYQPQNATAYDYSFELEKGDNPSYPLIYSADNNEVVVDEDGYATIAFTPEYDGKYTVDVEDGYIVINGYSYYDGETIYLEKDVELDVEYHSSTDTSKTKKVDFIVEPSKQDDSMSLFTASELSTDSENKTTVNYTNEFGNYFKYTNTSTVDQFVTLAGTSSDYHSTTYNVYDNELNEVDSDTNFAFYYSETIEIIVKAGETVYFEFTSDTSATDYVYISAIDAQADLLLENTNYIVSEATLFKVNYGSSTGLATFSFATEDDPSLINNFAEVTIYDSKGIGIEGITHTSHTTELFKAEGTKTFYVLVKNASEYEQVSLSFDFNEIATTSLSLYNEGDTLQEYFINTDDDKWYVYKNTSTENQMVRFELQTTNSYSSRYVNIIDTTGRNLKYGLYSNFYDTYELKPGETVYINVENLNSTYELYCTIKAELQ